MSSGKVRFAHLNAWIYAATRGHIGGSFGGHRVLLLTSIGCKTGRERRTPVQFEMLDDVPVIAGAGGGSPHAPLWCSNLRSDPRATVQIGREKWPAHAEEVTGEQRDLLRARLRAKNSALAEVERLAEREIPVFRLFRV